MQAKGTFYKRAFLVIAVVALLGACRIKPIYEVHSQEIPVYANPLTLSQIETRILAAGKNLGWQLKSSEPGLLLGTIRRKRHSATVRIKFDTKTFSILYERSHRMRDGLAEAGDFYEGKKVIHNRYNKYVRKLQRQIGIYLGPSDS